MTYNRWSTQQIPPQQRSAFWHDALHRAHACATPQILHPEQFDARLTSRSVGAIVLNRIHASAGLRLIRQPEDIASSGPPSLLLCLCLSGSACVSPHGVEDVQCRINVQANQPFVLDERHAYAIEHDGALEFLQLVVPLALLDVGQAALQDRLTCRLPSSAALLLLLQQMQLLDKWDGDLGDVEASQLSDLVMGTLQAVMQAGAGSMVAGGRRHGFLLQRVRQLIAQQYPDPQLSPASMAQRLGMPVRTMQAHLAREGTSLSAELMAYRLERAHVMLRGAGWNGLAVKDVSQRCGFSSPAHFSRRFRERFGGSPAGVLRKPPMAVSMNSVSMASVDMPAMRVAG